MDSEVLTDIKHLPNELAEDILYLLPVKDLLRFRSVCKAWKALIDSFRFKTKHFEASKRSFPPTLAIFRYITQITESHFLHLVFPNNPRNFSITNRLKLDQFLDSPTTLSQNHDTFPCNFKFGVVNGLVCLVYQSCLVIWNLSTRQFTRVDPPPLSGVQKSTGRIHTVVSAFGFDPITQDYKFVTIKFGDFRTAYFEIYSLQGNSWKCFTIDFPVVLPSVHTGDGYLDGKFYWFVKTLYKSHAIMKFDFSNDTLELIPWSYGDLFGLRYFIVVTIRGRLELIATFGSGVIPQQCEVWTVGGDGEWSRRLNFELSDDAFIPRGIWEDDLVIFQSRCNNMGWKRVVLYSSTGLCTDLEHESTAIWVFPFVESLFSVFQDGAGRSNNGSRLN